MRVLLLAVLSLFSLYGLSHLFAPNIPTPAFWQQPLQIIALEGGKLERPDNSLRALQASQEAGSHGFWLPLQLSLDQELVINADASVDRTSNGTGDIKNMTLAQLRGLDIGYWWPYHDPQDLAKLYVPTNQEFPFRGQGKQMVSLAEVSEQFPQQTLLLNLGEGQPNLRRALSNYLQQQQLWSNTLLYIEQQNNLNELRRLFPQAQTYATEAELRLLFVMQILRLEHLYPYRPSALLINLDQQQHSLLTTGMMRAAQRLNLGVYVLSTDVEAELIEELKLLGVQGLITAEPSKAAELVNRVQ